MIKQPKNGDICISKCIFLKHIVICRIDSCENLLTQCLSNLGISAKSGVSIKQSYCRLAAVICAWVAVARWDGWVPGCTGRSKTSPARRRYCAAGMTIPRKPLALPPPVQSTERALAYTSLRSWATVKIAGFPSIGARRGWGKGKTGAVEEKVMVKENGTGGMHSKFFLSHNVKSDEGGTCMRWQWKGATTSRATKGGEQIL